MFQIMQREQLNKDIVRFDVLAPRIANSAEPGQFIIVKADETSERIPLTICDINPEQGTVSIVIQQVGSSTCKINEFQQGQFFEDFVGPLGNPSDLVTMQREALKSKRILFVAGGLGAAPVYPQVKWLQSQGVKADVIIGARSKDILIMEKEMQQVAGEVFVGTDDGSYGFHGNVTVLLKDLVENRGKDYDLVVAIGPMVMMKFTCLTTRELGIPTIVSMNTMMVDGTGMCGACRLTVGDTVKFACVDGPEFDGHLIHWDEAMRRMNLYKTQKGRNQLEKTTPLPKHAENCLCNKIQGEFDKKKRVPMAEQDPKVRATNFEEVALGYTLEEAKREAGRCLQCKNAKCIGGCPVSIDIPAFIKQVELGNIEEAAKIIAKDSSLPAICGRVCPQEEQCEGVCIRGIKGEAVAIGRLERFVGDHTIKHRLHHQGTVSPKNKKVAVIGAGPAGLACAGDLAKKGYQVKIFEMLHRAGGVLVYGIPEFRLPKEKIVKEEIEAVRRLGVEIETNVVVGRTTTVEQLMEHEGYEAVFIGSGAGLPKFMGISGETANGVFSANEYLTRANLMKAYKEGYETPIAIGEKVAVVGGGNVAMDAARTALRFGSEVHIVYRRSEEELPARLEEIHHAKEEGVVFDILTNPTEIVADQEGNVTGMRCVRMQLGAPDQSGRRKPEPIAGSEFIMEVDTVLMALGTNPNPLISSTTVEMQTNKWGCIVIDEETGETTRKGVFAGGDAVTGAATVILAMGAGRKAAAGIDKYLREK